MFSKSLPVAGYGRCTNISCLSGLQWYPSMVGYPVTYMVTPARSTWYYHLYMHIDLFLELVQPDEWVVTSFNLTRGKMRAGITCK